MKRLYIAYFYNPDGDTEADVFVADEADDREEAFIKYAENNYDYKDMPREEIKGIYLIDTVADKKGVLYKAHVKEYINIKKLKEKQGGE